MTTSPTVIFCQVVVSYCHATQMTQSSLAVCHILWSHSQSYLHRLLTTCGLIPADNHLILQGTMSLLSSWTFCAKCNGHLSSSHTSVSCIHKDSVVSPLFFVMYRTPLSIEHHHSISVFKHDLYALQRTHNFPIFPYVSL